MTSDKKTADAFATSWNTLPEGSVYTFNDFKDWFEPLDVSDIENKTVLEMGCGGASFMIHLTQWHPYYLEGIDLGDSVISAQRNMEKSNFKNFKIKKIDIQQYKSDGFEIVYCLGVLHHLKNPQAGFEAVISNVKSGGRFHCWVYGKEGNAMVINFVEPIRKIACRLPWWLNKYFIATPLAIPFFIYSKIIFLFKNFSFLKNLPLYEYSCWIGKRNFMFFRHVAFDQLVTPQTTYIDKATVENWLKSDDRINQDSTYLIFRNGNSWKFGGKIN